MKLNMRIIRDHLPAGYRCKQFGVEQNELCLSRPVYYKSGNPLVRGKLYVAGVNAIPSSPLPEGIALICTGSRIPLEWMTSGSQILLVSGAEPLELLNDIHEIFNWFDQWDFQLSEALGRDSDFNIKELLQLGIEALDNPLYVVDASLQVNFSSQIRDGKISISDVPYPMSAEIRISIKESCQTERLLTVPFISSAEGQMTTYCQNLFLMGHFMGSVWYQSANRSFRDSDFALADHFFSYFVRGYRRYLRSFRKAESPMVAALRRLLEHSPLTEEDTEILALRQNECWHCFKLKERRNRKPMPKDYMFATLNAMMSKDVCATTMHNEIVGILRLSSDRQETTLNFFHDLLNRMDYIGGLGNGFRDLRKFGDSLLQASFVAERCSQRNEEGVVHFFQQQLLPYMLYECSGKLPPEELYSRGLQELIEYDRQRNTEYVKTLEVFLKNEMSIPKTSEELFIHRTSLLKRLDKIQRITGDDLNNPETRLYYRLCFALWDSGYAPVPEIAME